jgi:hypothetical protein
MDLADQLKRTCHLDVYPRSLAEADEGGAVLFMARRDGRKVVGSVGHAGLDGEPLGQAGGSPVVVAPLGRARAAAVRARLPWTAPRPIGLAPPSVGLGDRLGLATPGHVRAVRGRGLSAVLAQQSIREMTRTGRTPQDVLDDATWGALQEGYRDGFGADADHLQRPEDIDATLTAGFTFFTIDPGGHVENRADAMDDAELAAAFEALDFGALESSADDLRRRYLDRAFPLAEGEAITFDARTLRRAAVKYGGAVAHTVRLYRHLSGAAAGAFELEVSVDETATATSPAEHYFFASELRRLGVRWLSLAPRLVGRFEKGVDYIGDPDELRRSLARHVAVMRALGPYKISIHSGSDKFSIYPTVAELTGGLFHLKTAGTSYLEALRAVAGIDPELFRAILDFARERYGADRATYHVSADAARVPRAGDVRDADLSALLDDFDARQVLHVTYGSVLTAEGGRRFRAPLVSALQREEEAHYAAVERHIGRHLAPLAGR